MARRYGPGDGIPWHVDDLVFGLLTAMDRLTPIGSMVLLYMVTFTINIPQMLAYIPYMDPMGHETLAMIVQNYIYGN